ncbi:hypothetical protein FRB91_003218 [Serendipita sp. 411]|nr:hypothetical protein FRB91_003218 [Serendipita sp. 411]
MGSMADHSRQYFKLSSRPIHSDVKNPVGQSSGVAVSPMTRTNLGYTAFPLLSQRRLGLLLVPITKTSRGNCPWANHSWSQILLVASDDVGAPQLQSLADNTGLWVSAQFHQNPELHRTIFAEETDTLTWSGGRPLGAAIPHIIDQYPNTPADNVWFGAVTYVQGSNRDQLRGIGHIRK